VHPFHRGYRLLLGAALLAPGAAVAQESARPAVEVRLLGGLVNPGLAGLNEAFAGYRAAEQSGAPLRREPGVRRAVAGEIAGDERFGAGVGGALEVGISRAAGSEGRRLGLGVRLGYDRVRAGYSASFQDGREGSREELLQISRVSLVPRYSFVTPAFTATLGATAGVGRLEYRNDARTALVSPSGASTNPSAGFAGHDSFWSVGGLAEVERRLFGRASLTAGIGYDHVPTVELPVSGSDFDAPYRSLSTDPFPTPTLLAFPEEGGTMGEKPVPVDLSGWRAEAGVRLRVGM
jgi:hypothetical protein